MVSQHDRWVNVKTARKSTLIKLMGLPTTKEILNLNQPGLQCIQWLCVHCAKSSIVLLILFFSSCWPLKWKLSSLYEALKAAMLFRQSRLPPVSPLARTDAWGCLAVAVCAVDHIMLSCCPGLSCSGYACSRCYVVMLPGVVLEWLCVQQITLCCHTAWGLAVGVFAADHIMLSYCLGLSYSGRACNRLSCSRQHACIRSHYVVILPGVVLQWLCMQQITLCCHIYYLRVSCSGHVCSRSHYVVILPKIVLQWVCMQQITLCCHTAQGGLVEGMCAADHIMFSYCQSDWGRVVTDMFWAW